MKNSDTPVGAAGCPSSTPLPKATYTGTPALGLSEEMGAFGCLALELREAAPRVRGRNHRLNWSCQEGPLEPLKAGLPNSYIPDSHPCS